MTVYGFCKLYILGSIPVWYTPTNHGHCIFIIYDSAERVRTKQFLRTIIIRDRGHVGTKLEAKHIIYQKLANFMYKKDVYVDRLENVIFGL